MILSWIFTHIKDEENEKYVIQQALKQFLKLDTLFNFAARRSISSNERDDDEMQFSIQFRTGSQISGLNHCCDSLKSKTLECLGIKWV